MKSTFERASSDVILDKVCRISVITATYNSAAKISSLIDSLRTQTDKNFEWIIADGASTDNTVSLLESVTDIDIKIISSPDFGVYDALNRAIKICSERFYVVIGSDDYFYPQAIEYYRKSLVDDLDIVAASIAVSGKIVRPGRGPAWLYGQGQFVAGHSVGTLFRKSLHDVHGYYSNKFPIAADQLFIKKCCQAGAKIKKIDYVAGNFSVEGISSIDLLGMLSEFYRVQFLTEKSKKFQTLLYFIRLLINFRKL